MPPDLFGVSEKTEMIVYFGEKGFNKSRVFGFITDVP